MKDMKNKISNLEYENQNLQMTVDQLEMQNSQQDMTLSNLEMSNQQLENESSQLQRDVFDLNVSNRASKKTSVMSHDSCLFTRAISYIQIKDISLKLGRFIFKLLVAHF